MPTAKICYAIEPIYFRVLFYVIGLFSFYKNRFYTGWNSWRLGAYPQQAIIKQSSLLELTSTNVQMQMKVIRMCKPEKQHPNAVTMVTNTSSVASHSTLKCIHFILIHVIVSCTKRSMWSIDLIGSSKIKAGSLKKIEQGLSMLQS